MLMTALTTLNSKEKNVQVPKKRAEETDLLLPSNDLGGTGSALTSCHENPSLIFATDMLFY